MNLRASHTEHRGATLRVVWRRLEVADKIVKNRDTIGAHKIDRTELIKYIADLLAEQKVFRFFLKQYTRDTCIK